LDVYKPYDYEPVLIHSGNNEKKVVISRFHWKTATIWFDTFTTNGKPHIAFIRGFHTPIVRSTNYDRWFMLKTDDLIEKINFNTNFYNFEKLLTDPDAMFNGNQIDYADLVINEPVPQEYRFVLDDIRSLVVIGHFDQDVLPPAIRKLLQIQEQVNKQEKVDNFNPYG
jgi:hypothetical protein